MHTFPVALVVVVVIAAASLQQRLAHARFAANHKRVALHGLTVHIRAASCQQLLLTRALSCPAAVALLHATRTPTAHPRAYADSKTLSEGERSRLFKALAADLRCVYVADLLSAQLISGQMLGRARVSLNAVAEQSTMGLIQDVLDAGVQLKEV
jgi:hypothetical protein